MTITQGALSQTIFTKNFNNTTVPNLPSGWSSIVSPASTQTAIKTEEVYLSNPIDKRIQMKNGNKTNPNDNVRLILITPQQTTLTSQSTQISFYAKRNYVMSDLVIGTVPNTYSNATFTPFQTIPLTETNTLYTVVFDSSYTSSDTYIAFSHNANTANQYIFIDDVEYEYSPEDLPNCSSNQTSTQTNNCGNYPLEFSWDTVASANGYKFSLGTAPGLNDIENETDLGNITNYTIDTPTPNSIYYWSITPYNASGSATDCLEFQHNTLTPCYYTPHPISVHKNGITNVQIGAINNSTSPISSAPYYVDFSNLTTDVTSGTSENISITFETSTPYSTFVWIDWNNDLDFDDIDEMYHLGDSNGSSPTIENWSIDIPPTASAGNRRMRIGGIDSSYGYDQSNPLNPNYSLDNNELANNAEFEDYTLNVIASNCIKPFDLAINNVSTNFATLSWTDYNNGSYSYTLNWRKNGSSSWSSIILNATNYTISNLISETEYEWNVTTDCGSNTVSGNNFTTMCNAISAPYTYGFEENGTLNSCWNQENYQDEFDWSINSNNTPTAYTGPNSANTGTYYIYTDSRDKNANDEAILYSPNIDISSLSNPLLKFNYHMYSGNTNNDGNLDVSISTDNRVTYTSIFNQTGSQGILWNLVEIDLSNYNGIVNIKFTVTIGENGSLFQNDYAIDDFSIENGSNCNGINYTWNNFAWAPVGTPTINDTVTINDIYLSNLHGNIDACTLTVTTNGLLEVKAGDYININNDIINNGIINVFTTGSVVQINDNANVNGSGNFNTQIETATLLDQNRYTYFSSPVQNEDLSVFSSWAQMNKIYVFNPVLQSWGLTLGTENMTPGKGFVVKGDDNGTYPSTALTQFHGAFNNGLITQNTYHNVGVQELGAADDDSTLIGNPYPSAVNANSFLNHNTNIDALYFWTHATAADFNGNFSNVDYAVWTLAGGTQSLSGKIAAGQGVLVTTNDLNLDFPSLGTVEFNNSMRLTTGNNDFRSQINGKRVWLNLLNNNTNHFKQILVSFLDENTDGFDHQFDAKTNSINNQFNIYTLDNELNELVINSSNFNSNEKEIPLGLSFETNTNSNFKISIDHLEELDNVSIYVKDNLLNTFHDLKLNDFNINPNNETLINDRYVLVFRNNEVLSNNDLESDIENLIISNYTNNQILVKMDNGSKMISMRAYSTLGKILIDTNDKSDHFIINKQLKQGQVLFFTIQLENGKILNKKFIKD